ncbi:methyltransferase domain-containing protein [Deferribacteraceae bacterium V6Fe1]|nr:methyltransferase domain-containing protein [Deferribacteraceae bacterium V6Fe1]
MTKLKEVFSSNTLIEAVLKYIENQYGLKINELNTDKVFDLIYKNHISDLGFDEEVLEVVDRQISDFLFNNESYFFRYPAQLELILNHCKNNLAPTIVSFGSSNGQEAYSISMYLKESGLNPTIVGVDIDEQAVENAKTGIYSPYSLQKLPEKFAKYFSTLDNKKFILADKIKNNVHFYKLNILKDDIGKILPDQKADIVLMNNILIYMNKKTIDYIIEKIANILKPGGILLTTEEEYSIKTFQNFLKSDKTNNCKFYTKPNLEEIAPMEYRELFEIKIDKENTEFDYESLKIKQEETTIEDAKQYFNKDNFLNAIAISYNILKNDPLNDEALIIISESFYKLGFNTEAKKWLKTYLIINSNKEEKIEQYLNLCLKTKDFFEYIRILKKKIALLNKKDDIIRLREILNKVGLNAEELYYNM